MASPRVADRIKETSTTTGTGNFTLLGAVTQFKSFSSRFASGASMQAADQVGYAIVGQTGTEWEVGRGYLSGASTLVRDTIRASSNADALVNFSAGTKDVFCTITAFSIYEIMTKGQTLAAITSLNLP